MPRVLINYREYKEQGFKDLISSYARRQRVKLQDIAKMMGIDRATLYRHLSSGKVSYGELLEIIDILKLTDEEVLELMRLHKLSRRESKC